MGFFSKNQIDMQELYMDQSYHGFEEQLLWRYKDLKDRYVELLDRDAPISGDDYFTTDDYRYAPIHYLKTICNVSRAMELAKEDLAEKCDIIVHEDGSIEDKDDEEDTNQITTFEIVLLPTWFQTAVAA